MISSARNRKLKDIRRLKRSKGDEAVLEGPHLVREALRAGIDLDPVLMTPEFADGPGAEIVAEMTRSPELVEARLLDAVMDADTPRGVAAVARLPRGDVSTLPVVRSTHLYLDGVQDPGNLGAIVRVAEAAGVAAVACGPGTVHPNHPRALRGSAGSLLRVPVAREAEVHEVDRHLHTIDPTWIALDPHRGTDLYETDLPRVSVLALGAEGPGLSPRVERRAGLRIRIPTAGEVESLNVAVAAAVVLFEMVRRQSS